MTHVGPAPASSSTVSTPGASFVEWGAVLAGAVLAAAISFVLLTFGAAIGLSATSPWPNSGVSAKVIASIAVFWAMAQQIGAFMAGGYVAGRMRSRWHETGHEADFRDGLHGGLVWAVGVVIGAALFLSAAGGAAKTGAEIAGQAGWAARFDERPDGCSPGYDAPPDHGRPGYNRSSASQLRHGAAAPPTPRARVTSAGDDTRRRDVPHPRKFGGQGIACPLRTGPIWPSSWRSGPACPSRKPRDGWTKPSPRLV